MVMPVRQPPQGQAQFIQFGKWKPDVALPMNDGMQFALNLKSRTDGFYGPELGPTIPFSQDTALFGDALKVHGNVHSVPSEPGGSPRYYVGTFAVAAGASRILTRTETGAWLNVSRGGGYNIDSAKSWRFANFGNKVLASTLGNTLQISDGGTGQFRNVNAGIRGADVATVRGFAVLVDINDTAFGEGVQPYRVWWSAIANAENWPDPISDEAVTVQSGFFDLLGGGRLRRIVPGIGGADAIIIAERKMWRMRFVGSPRVFDFDEIQSDLGTSISGSVAALNETFFFYGHNGFYWFNGSQAQPIGKGVVEDFFLGDANFNSTFGFERAVEASIDSVNNCYVVTYRGQNAGGLSQNNRILRYNYLTDSWSNAAVSCDALGHLDSNATQTDSPHMVVIGQDFELATLEGDALEVTFEGPEQFSQSGGYSQIDGVMPLVDGAGAVVSVKTRNTLFGDIITSAEFAFQRDGWVRFGPAKISGRFYRCRIRVPAGTSWTAVTGMMYEWMETAQGVRRTS
jgi:hypothetical protein